MPRDIVSPRVVQVIIQENRWKQTKLERPAGLELLDDLPGAEVLFVRVGTDKVEVELIGKGFGEKVSPARERFQIEELILQPGGERFARPGRAERCHNDRGAAGCGRQRWNWRLRNGAGQKPRTTNRCAPRARCTRRPADRRLGLAASSGEYR